MGGGQRQGLAKPVRRDRRTWLKRVEYVVVRGILLVLRVLPLPVAYWLAEQIVVVFLLAVGKYRARTIQQLDIAFGAEKTAEWKRDMLWRCHRYLAWYFVDTLLAPRLLAHPTYAAAVDITEVESVMRRDGVLEKTGALLIAGHHGAPEVGSLRMAAAGWPHAAVIRPLDNPYLWDYIEAQRTDIPRTAVAHRGALRQAYKILKKKGIVALQVDQDSRGAGVFVPYFGHQAHTHPGAAELCLLSGAPVYLVSCVRTAPRRFRFLAHCRGPIDFTPTGDHDADILRLTTLMTSEVEKIVREHPEQAMWAHRRWKTRPPGERPEDDPTR